MLHGKYVIAVKMKMIWCLGNWKKKTENSVRWPISGYYTDLFVCVCKDCLCGLVVRVPDYRSRGPGSIPDTTRFSEK
jgi:hypothetical protein